LGAVALQGFRIDAFLEVQQQPQSSAAASSSSSLALPQLSTTQERTTSKDTRPLVVIVVCTKSLPNWGQNISSTGLHTLLIPSIERTVTIHDLRHYRVEFVIGFDKGDEFWENERNRQALGNDTSIPLNFVSIVKDPQRPHHIPFNQACRAAYDYGADYIARVNDDTEFVTSNWIQIGIHALAAFDPPNVGVVGPIFKDGNTQILTHDFVHRTHLDIFNDYYPHEFDNWWIDDWITVVYQRSGRCKKLENWRVEHHIMLHGGGNSRYKITHSQKQLLEHTVQRGMQSIDRFLHNGTSGETIQPVLGTSKIHQVWGPMASFSGRIGR
jgi:hypothetical protein